MSAAAIALSSLGWKVFPTLRRKPVVKDWPGLATTDHEQLCAWWERWPDADPAVHAGASGLVVLDIDGAEGWASMPELERINGAWLEPTLKVQTGRGEHWYYRRPDRPCGNGTAIHGLAGLDVRADRGFVFAPGARHRSKAGDTTGHTYQFIVRPRCPLGVLRHLANSLPIAPACICLDADSRPGRKDDAKGAFADVFNGGQQ